MKTEDVSATLKSNSSSTRSLRQGRGIGAAKIGSVAPQTIMNGTTRFVAEIDGEFGVNSKLGDIWWLVKGVDVKEFPAKKFEGFVAERHAGETLLTVTLTDPAPNPGPQPETQPQFPSEFTMTDPSGAKALYVFLREIK